MDQRYPDELRLSLLKHLCVPILNRMEATRFLKQFEEKGVALMKIANNPLAGSIDNQAKKSLMIEKIIAFTLFELLFKTLSPPVIKEKINKLYTKNDPQAKGTEFTSDFMRCAHTSKSELILVDDTISQRLIIDYHSTAFRALAAAVICTQTKENFFTVFMFKENKDKNEYLWENIIDLHQKYNFQVETQFPTVKRFINKTLVDFVIDDQNNKIQAPTFLGQSSLAADLERPMLAEAMGQQSSQINKQQQQDKDKQQQQQLPQTLDDNQQVEMESAQWEMDTLNSNLCLQVFCDVIRLLQSKFGTTYETAEMPKWMYELWRKFTATGKLKEME